METLFSPSIGQNTDNLFITYLKTWTQAANIVRSRVDEARCRGNGQRNTTQSKSRGFKHGCFSKSQHFLQQLLRRGGRRQLHHAWRGLGTTQRGLCWRMKPWSYLYFLKEVALVNERNSAKLYFNPLNDGASHSMPTNHLKKRENEHWKQSYFFNSTHTLQPCPNNNNNNKYCLVFSPLNLNANNSKAFISKIRTSAKFRNVFLSFSLIMRSIVSWDFWRLK